jgi:hypothetical protein
MFMLVTSFALYSCTKENKIVVRYGQTQCSDKWGYGNNDTETVQKMVVYLKAKGITVSSPNLSSAPADFISCLACTCPSGRVFTVTASGGDEEKLKAEGFNK